MKPEDLKIIADLTVELTKLKIKETPHLCIENFAADLFGKLLREHMPTNSSSILDEVGVSRMDTSEI